MPANRSLAGASVHLSDAERRYLELFGGPNVAPGSSRRPYAGAVRVVNAPASSIADVHRGTAER